MPNKTIYVRDEDLLVFEEAEKLGKDSLSAVIAEALKRFVEMKKMEAQGVEKFTLGIDSPDQGERTVKFIGRLLAEDRRYNGQTSDRRDRWTDWALYQTKAGKIIIYRACGTAWQGESGYSEYIVRDSLPEYDNDVFNFGETVPGSLLEEAAAALGEERVEWIE